MLPVTRMRVSGERSRTGLPWHALRATTMTLIIADCTWRWTLPPAPPRSRRYWCTGTFTKTSCLPKTVGTLGASLQLNPEPRAGCQHRHRRVVEPRHEGAASAGPRPRSRRDATVAVRVLP
jgi:hypothetical protein